MKTKFMTNDYPASLTEQNVSSTAVYVATVVCIVMLILWPTQIPVWILVIFMVLMSVTMWRANNSKSVPAISIPILELLSSASHHADENNLYYMENKERVNRAGYFRMDDVDYDPAEEEESQKEELRRRIRNREAARDIDDDESWTI